MEGTRQYEIDDENLIKELSKERKNLRSALKEVLRYTTGLPNELRDRVEKLTKR